MTLQQFSGYLKKGLLRMIARKAFFTFLVSAYTNFQAFLFNFMFVRLWGFEEVGLITFVVSFVGLFSFLIDFQFSTAHTFYTTNNPNDGKNLGAYIIVKTVLSVILFFVVVGSVVLSGENFSSQTIVLILIVLLANIETIFAQIPLFSFRARLLIFKAEIPNIIAVTFGFIFRIFVLFLTRDIVLLTFSYVIISSLQLLVGIAIFRGIPISFPDVAHLKLYFRFTIPFLLSTSISMFLLYFDKILIGINFSDAILGQYFTLQSIANVFELFSKSIGTILLPLFSSFYVGTNLGEITRLIKRSERYLSLFLLPIIIMGLTFGITVLELIYGRSFGITAPLFAIFILVQFLSSINRPYVFSVVGAKKTSLAATITIIESIIKLILLLVSVQFGVVAVGISLLIASIIQSIVWRIICKKYYNISINDKTFLHWLGAILMFIFMFNFNLLMQTFFIHSLISIFLSCILGFSFYLILMYIVKEFREEEYTMIINIFKLGRSKN